MRHSSAAARGFTLLELLVGMTVALLVFSATTEVMVFMNGQRRIAQGHAEVSRDATVAVGWLRRDFAGTKSGDATFRMAPGSAVAVAGSNLDPPVRGFSSTNIPGNKELAVLTDIPRPDSNFDGFMSTGQADIGGSSPWVAVPVLSELSGRISDSNLPRDSTSILPLSVCAAVADVGCPWGLRKIMVGDVVQVVVPNNFWQNQTVTALEPSSSGLSPSGIYHAIRVTPGMERIANRPFVAGRVVQLDRVGYRLRQVTSGPLAPGVLERRHCWGGAVDPGDASFLLLGSPGAPGTATTPTNCGATDSGWMTIARNVDVDSTANAVTRSRFRYFDLNGVELGLPIVTTSPVGSVQLDLRFKKSARTGTGNSRRAINLNLNERVIIRR